MRSFVGCAAGGLLFAACVTASSAQGGELLASASAGAYEIRTLEQFQVVSVEMQRAAFQKLSPEARADLWREKLGRVLASGRLNSEQAAVVEQMRGFLSPAVYDGRVTQAELRDRVAGAVKVFPKDQFKRTFMSLAPVDREGTAAREFVAKPPSLNVPENCECSTADDWCVFSGQICAQMSTLTCTYTHGGCGTLFAFDCDGKCVPVQFGLPGFDAGGITVLVMLLAFTGSAFLLRRRRGGLGPRGTS